MGKWWLNGRSHGADAAIEGDTKRARVYSPCEVREAEPVVYFALAVGANMVKIGTVVEEARVARRMDLLQPGCPYELKVLLILPGFGRREEAKLHRLFAAQAFRGEWFRCDGALKELLQLAHVEGKEAAISLLRSKNI
jgi:hypothetical protein